MSVILLALLCAYLSISIMILIYLNTHLKHLIALVQFKLVEQGCATVSWYTFHRTPLQIWQIRILMVPTILVMVAYHVVMLNWKHLFKVVVGVEEDLDELAEVIADAAVTKAHRYDKQEIDGLTEDASVRNEVIEYSREVETWFSYEAQEE